MAMYSLTGPVSDNTARSLGEFEPLLQKLLFCRGIGEAEEARKFLNPDYDAHTHDPFLMLGMDAAVERILIAISKNEKTVIYSDYDHDGIPGGVILHDFFKKIGYENFENYIPHRALEGYGMNIPAIEKFSEEGVNLVITVDLGITDIASADRASELKMDLIITDHHLPGKKLPKAHAILNPKQKGDSYPFDGLCGAGVSYKLVQALIKKGDRKNGGTFFDINEGWEKWLMDMVGISTIADMVPLVGENRIFAGYGLKVLRKSRRPGIEELCKKMKVNQRFINEDDVGFMIAPRINAAGRMDTPDRAFELLSTAERGKAEALAEHLDKVNNERKGLSASIVKEIRKRLDGTQDEKKVIVMGNVNWRPPLLGITANKIVEEYGKPVFLWGRERGMLKGSCRSDGSVDVFMLMERTGDILDGCGGHSLSGGFLLNPANLPAFEEKLICEYGKIARENSNRQVPIDGLLSLDEVTWKTHSLIEALSPFGTGNPKPLFMFPNSKIAGISRFGKEDAHMRIDFLSDKTGKRVQAIGFFMKPESFGKTLEIGGRVDLVATMEKSYFKNYPELRLRIVDIV